MDCQVGARRPSRGVCQPRAGGNLWVGNRAFLRVKGTPPQKGMGIQPSQRPFCAGCGDEAGRKSKVVGCDGVNFSGRFMLPLRTVTKSGMKESARRVHFTVVRGCVRFLIPHKHRTPPPIVRPTAGGSTSQTDRFRFGDSIPIRSSFAPVCPPPPAPACPRPLVGQRIVGRRCWCGSQSSFHTRASLAFTAAFSSYLQFSNLSFMAALSSNLTMFLLPPSSSVSPQTSSHAAFTKSSSPGKYRGFQTPRFLGLLLLRVCPRPFHLGLIFPPTSRMSYQGSDADGLGRQPCPANS